MLSIPIYYQRIAAVRRQLAMHGIAMSLNSMLTASAAHSPAVHTARESPLIAVGTAVHGDDVHVEWMETA